MLFLNRRGLNSALFCQDCGQTVKCSACNVSLTHHAKAGKSFLLCHHCGRVFYSPEKCAFCASPRLILLGFGTQKIEEILKKDFPQAKILRADRDIAATKKGVENNLKDFFEGSADILIGTQIISKGFDSDEIGLVGIILADSSLQIPDFRSQEKTFQVLTQTIGRTCRQNEKGEVILQTFLPENELIKQIAEENYQAFYEKEIIERKKHFLPPFSRLIKLIFVDKSKEKAFKEARKIQAQIEKRAKKEEIIYLSPALVPFKYGKFHVHLFIYSKKPELLIKGLKLDKVKIDIDPVDTL